MATKGDDVSGAWIDELVGGLGQYFKVETLDGVVRDGRFTSIRSRELQLDGRTVALPTEVEINGDPMDTVPIDRIASIIWL